MSILRPLRSGLALLLPAAFLILLLVYETRTTVPFKAETGRTPKPLTSVSTHIAAKANPDQRPVRTRVPAGDTIAMTELASPILAPPELVPAELMSGELAMVPRATVSLTATTEPEATKPANLPLTTITVEAGQTLAGIAASHGTTQEAIQKLNNIFDPQPAGGATIAGARGCARA